jgi:hypothetical protein
MNAETLKALKGSIKKWEKIVAGTGMDEGTANCPLCQLFFYPRGLFGKPCAGCPVSEKTGWSYCTGTPYHEYVGAVENLGTERGAAKAELKFLRSLLPKKAKAKPTRVRKSNARKTTSRA